MISPRTSSGKRACGVFSRSRLRKNVILTQRCPFLRRRLMQKGSMTEANHVETTKVARSISAFASSGTSMSRVEAPI